MLLGRYDYGDDGDSYEHVYDDGCSDNDGVVDENDRVVDVDIGYHDDEAMNIATDDDVLRWLW